MVHRHILVEARESFARRAWGEAYAQLVAADRDEPLVPEDLELLGEAAYLVGDDETYAATFERAHHAYVDAGDIAGAVRAAFWLAFGLLNRGETARGGGWLARAHRLVDEHDLDRVERGYLLIPVALRALDEGDLEAAQATFGRALATGERFEDPDLIAMGRLGQGEARIGLGDAAEGMALLDEVMVSVTADEVSPIVTGTVYCAVIHACRDAFDLRRAREWTEALSQWCETQPDLVPFRGQCLVHRSEIMQLHGDWTDALDEVERACDRLSDPPHPAVGSAYYQLGELHRLRGDLTAADHAYQQARRWGRQPQPGLALLRLAQGETDAASATIRRVLHETQDELTRARMLEAYVEVMLAADDTGAARAAADELAVIAEDRNAPLLSGLSSSATGAVLLAEGEASAAIGALEDAGAIWQELDAVHEHARTRVRFALACRALGDDDTAELELRGARAVFEELGAAPDVAWVDGIARATSAPPGGLTERQIEVLTLVAEGMTNRDIAGELVISEHTVRRHLQNIFLKLGVSSRAAATAFAVEQGLVRGRGPRGTNGPRSPRREVGTSGR